MALDTHTSTPSVTLDRPEAAVAPPAVGILPPPTAAEIDGSCRAPLSLLFGAGVLWLIAGLLLALIASIKLHGPGFLADTAWLTLGRVRPAAMNALLYGWATPTAVGIVLWMFCRLGRTRLPAPNVVWLAAWFWNFGVLLGWLAILAGETTGFEWLEMPRYAAPILFVSFGLIGLVALAAFHHRRDRTLYVSQWYLLAGVFLFLWIYSAANLLLLFFTPRGVMQAAVNAWYTNNLFQLWFVPAGLGTVFYFIPKCLGRPLYSSRLAAFGFWTLVLFGSWSGMAQLIGGPLPAWMVSVSVAANLLLVVPVLAVAINWHNTLAGQYRQAWSDATLRYVLFGAASYLVLALVVFLQGLPPVSELTHFTYVGTGRTWLALVGFLGMTLFGAVHYIVPRLYQSEWAAPSRVNLHFWLSAVGSGLIFLVLTIGGLVQGAKMNLGTVDFVKLNKVVTPFVGMSTLGLLLLLAGQGILLSNLAQMVRDFYQPARRGASSGGTARGKHRRARHE